jgi:hypothetical protein
MFPLPHQLAAPAEVTTRRAGYTAPTEYVPLALETRPAVDTAAAAHYLSRRPQTLREWACKETFPAGLRPFRVNGRLAWPVEGIRRALGVA